MTVEALHCVPGSLLGRAASGDVTAFGELAGIWASNTAAGKVNYAEGIVATGFWQRLASATGDGNALLELAEVLLAHGTFAARHDREARAIWLGAEAIRRLEQSADVGVEAAVARLVQVGPLLRPESLLVANQWREDPIASELSDFDRVFRDAAGGSVAAVSEIYQNALADVEQENIGVLEGLVLLEATARLGAASGDLDSACRLGKVLIRRASFDRSCGVDDPACTREGECLSILTSLAAADSDEAVSLLAQAVEEFLPRASILSAIADGRILASLPPKGNC
ncbi:hypothetical protein Q5H91_03570 [Sphingomonas sp. KR1UV-12]|uniref:Uncharacterized protein n=1 Tax=Sphingomonas aurea TaxID=3063994 RepID=A0ABT9EH36_9SPHN|nr:hypothetical protein [Sphingomonas sp. KR1UV-12]MDP1026279.1 hypothetical protein [Sphingomonas sp. KR1UV-12]